MSSSHAASASVNASATTASASRHAQRTAVSAPPTQLRGLLLTLDVIVVFFFLLSIIQPYLLQTRLMSMQHQARSIYDERISLLTQVSQALYVTAAAMHENPDDLCNTQNYTLVGYYDPDWKLQSEQDNALPPLGALNLSWDNLDAPPAGSPAERVCISREMAEASQISGISGSVHTLTLCD